MDEMADIEDLPKRVEYRQYREEGYGVREAAEMAGYSGPPPPEARALDDTDIQVRRRDKVIEEYIEARREECRLEFQLQQTRRRREALRARVEAVERDDST